jgi:hypothetical protein
VIDPRVLRFVRIVAAPAVDHVKRRTGWADAERRATNATRVVRTVVEGVSVAGDLRRGQLPLGHAAAISIVVRRVAAARPPDIGRGPGDGPTTPDDPSTAG